MISIIIPTLNRQEKLRNCLDSLLKSVTDNFYDIIVIIEDEKDYKICDEFIGKDTRVEIIPIMYEPLRTPVYKWNVGLSLSKYRWIFLGADDLIFPLGWDRDSLAVENKGFIGFGDTDWEADKGFCPHFLVTTDWLKTFNGGVLAIPHYHHYGFDIETSLRAQRSETYTVSPIRLEHKHPIYDPKQMDSTYQKGMAMYSVDMQTFLLRKRKGFPDDFQSIL